MARLHRKLVPELVPEEGWVAPLHSLVEALQGSSQLPWVWGSHCNSQGQT